MHQLAAHGAVRPGVVAGLPGRRAGRHRRPHAGVLVRARDRPRAAGDDGAGDRLPGRGRQRLRRSGTPSTTTTGRRCTSSTPTASSATTTSAKGATSNRSASSSGCSASSASSSPSRGSAWRRRPTGTTCARPRRTSATRAASTSRHRAAPRSTNAAPTSSPSACASTTGPSPASGRSGARTSCSTRPAAASPTGSTRATRISCCRAGAREPIPFRVLLDGEAPGPSHGVDVDEDGNGVLRDGRLYQLVRAARHGPRADAGDHVPRARRRGVRVHVRVAGVAPRRRRPRDRSRRRPCARTDQVSEPGPTSHSFGSM